MKVKDLAPWLLTLFSGPNISKVKVSPTYTIGVQWNVIVLSVVLKRLTVVTSNDDQW